MLARRAGQGQAGTRARLAAQPSLSSSGGQRALPASLAPRPSPSPPPNQPPCTDHGADDGAEAADLLLCVLDAPDLLVAEGALVQVGLHHLAPGRGERFDKGAGLCGASEGGSWGGWACARSCSLPLSLVPPISHPLPLAGCLSLSRQTTKHMRARAPPTRTGTRPRLRHRRGTLSKAGTRPSPGRGC